MSQVRLHIRGFGDGQLVLEERLTLPTQEMENLLPALTATHTARLRRYAVHMIEIEFLDEPNPLERYFRIGTDPRCMVNPIAILQGSNRAH